ncbi:MAG: hypothetical protein WA055_01220, partial [Candidatus Moraniibacteriota bacterium]
MKKIILIMIAIVIAFGAVNAQNVNLNYVKVDSVTNVTPTSAIAWCHYNALIAVGFRQFCHGTGGNFNSNCSVATLMNPVADTTIAITLTGLTPSTTYSYKAKVLPGAASGSSAVGTFTTPSCFPTPVISSSTNDSICAGILDTLTASTLGATYQWKRNNVIIAGATA